MTSAKDTAMRGPGITLKLLAWCLVLIAVFYATTTYLFNRIENIVERSGKIVRVNYEVDTAGRMMVARLTSFKDNKWRWTVLQRAQFRKAALADMASYERILDDTLELDGVNHFDWFILEGELMDYRVTSGSEGPMAVEFEDVNRWIELLNGLILRNNKDMKQGLENLEGMGREAAHLGLLGLMASLGLGVSGSLVIAWRLNRSLREVRRGIRLLGQGGKAQPVRILSRDEIGELAGAFNHMAAVLDREERMRSDFISMLSHEIRTPLTSIRESVELIRDGAFGEVTPGQERFLDISHKEATRLSNLLDRLLMVSKMEAEGVQVDPVPVDGHKLVREAVQRLSAAAMNRNVSMNVHPGGEVEPLMVLAGEDDVGQVLANLLSNAVKFSPERGRVEVALESVQGEGVFRVCDQGPGVPEEEQPHLFHMYYRGKGAREGVGGTGIGLAVSRRIVEAHGGRMWLEEREPWSACFCFTLPLAPAVV